MKRNPHNLTDAELELFTTIEQRRSIVFLSSKEATVKYGFLKAFLLESLENGKTFVFRARNIEWLYAFLKEIDLDQLALALSKDTQIKKTQFKAALEVDRSYHVEAIKSSISYEKEVELLRLSNYNYRKDVFGTYPILKLAELLYLSKKRGNTFNLDLDLGARHYTFDQKEFWIIHSKLEKASKYYKPSFSFLRSSDEFRDDVYKEFHLSENQAAVFKHLQNFISDAQEISNKYRQAFSTIREKLINRYKGHIAVIKKLNRDLETQIEFYKIEYELAPSKKSFARPSDQLERQKLELRSRLSVLVEEVKSKHLLKITPPLNTTTPNIEALSAFSADLNRLIDNHHLLVQNKVEEEIEILNSNNYDAPELSELVRSQSDLIFAINESKLLKKEVNHLSISAWNNYEFLKSLTKDLLKMRLFLECNTDYAIYRSFESSLPKKISALISALENIKNSEWIPCFETWYFNALFNKYAQNELSSITNQFQTIGDIKERDATYRSYRIEKRFAQLREYEVDLRRKVSKEGTDWKTAMLHSKSSFKFNFPIIVCDEKFFTSELTNFEYDYLICVENEEIPQNIFTNSHFESILCLHSIPISKTIKDSAYTSQNYSKKLLVNLKVKTLPTGEGVMEILKDKITLAKSLTFILGLSSLEKHFYSARDFSIITCLSPFVTKLLELELLDVRIKALKYTHLESGIVEDVVLKEDASKYLVIQDGYLDPELDAEWQISVLEKIKSTGIKLIIISSEKLAQNPHKSILDLIDIPEVSAMSIIEN